MAVADVIAEDARLYLSLHQCALTARLEQLSESKSNLSSKDHKDQKDLVSQKISMTTDLFWCFFSTHGDVLHIFEVRESKLKVRDQQSTVFPRFFSEVPIGTQEVPVLNQKDLSWDPQTE